MGAYSSSKQTSTVEHIQESGCKDIKCLCENDNLLQVLTYDLLRRCDIPDQNRTAPSSFCDSIVMLNPAIILFVARCGVLC